EGPAGEAKLVEGVGVDELRRRERRRQVAPFERLEHEAGARAAGRGGAAGAAWKKGHGGFLVLRGGLRVGKREVIQPTDQRAPRQTDFHHGRPEGCGSGWRWPRFGAAERRHNLAEGVSPGGTTSQRPAQPRR